METALDLLKAIGNVSSGLKIIGGGPLYWAAALGFAIFALMLGVWIHKAKNRAAFEESKKNEQQEQTGGKTENSTVEDALKDSEEAVKKARLPDGEKKTRG